MIIQVKSKMGTRWKEFWNEELIELITEKKRKGMFVPLMEHITHTERTKYLSVGWRKVN